MAQDLYEFWGQLDETRRLLVELAAAQRPGDEAAAQAITEALNLIEQSFLSDQAEHEPSVDEAFNNLLGLGTGKPSLRGTRIAPDVQSLDETVLKERLYAVADLYFIYMHERLGVFAVTRELQKQFKAGQAKLSTGDGAERLYRWDRRQVLRYTEKERHQVIRRRHNAHAKRGAEQQYVDVLSVEACGKIGQLAEQNHEQREEQQQ